MGYLNRDVVTVDAVLTKRGRELLSQGRSAFQITKFAVSDDEIDYGLYDLAHPLGTEFYGSAIENMPVVEASTDDAQNLRYKLVSLDRSFVTQVNVIPTINVGIGSIEVTFGQGASPIITPTTTAGANSADLDGPTFGYTAVLYDASAATVQIESPVLGGTAEVPVSDNIQVAKGISFRILPKDVSSVIRTTLVIYGNQTGATISLPITVNPRTVV